MLYIFDMGGVLIRNFHMFPALASLLGLTVTSFQEIDPRLSEALERHAMGLLDEQAFWMLYQDITGRTIPHISGSLLGCCFKPTLDQPTVQLVQELKQRGLRVVCGTNVIDAHYRIHQDLHQYDVFDHVYASYLMHLRKPDPLFYEYILKVEHVQSSEAFFIDDTRENVNAAETLGIPACLYTNADQLRKELPV